MDLAKLLEERDYALRSGRRCVGVQVDMDFAELEAYLEDEDQDDV